MSDPSDHEPPSSTPESGDSGADGTETGRDPLDLARRVADAYRTGGPPVAPRRPRRAKPSPRRKSREDPTDLASVLGDVVRERGWDERLAAQRVFTDWPQIVGTEIAQHSQVESFADAVVTVRTSSTAWATQLRLLAPRLVAKLNDAIGEGSVLRVEVLGPQAPSWTRGRRSIRGARGPRDTYG